MAEQTPNPDSDENAPAPPPTPWLMRETVLQWAFVIVVTGCVGLALTYVVTRFGGDTPLIELALWAGAGVFLAYLLSLILKDAKNRKDRS